MAWFARRRQLDLRSAWRTFAASAAAAVQGLTNMARSASGDGDVVTLDAGDIAPDFELEGSDGRTYRLRDSVGTRAVVIAWFPKAFTGG